MTKILIIGGGNIGSRHLQGVLNTKHKLSITMVDPSEEALKICKMRTDDIHFDKFDKKIKYRKDLPKNENFEICIISTNADVRAKVTVDLLNHCTARFIIFEKILFQSKLDYLQISNLLEKKKTRAWVNCPNRIDDLYIGIKKTLNHNNSIKMKVKGSSWGLTCNSIHYIDLFSYFVNSSDLRITNTKFSNEILENKRGDKFKELSGQIECRINNHLLEISCQKSSGSDVIIDISNEKITYSINKTLNKFKSNLNGFVQSQNFDKLYQSSMTGKLIDNLIDDNKCNLITYKESCKLHLPLLSKFIFHFSKILKKEITECPIT